MNYREIKTDGFLSNFIKCFWESEAEKDSEVTILPDGYFDLILELEKNKIRNIKLTGIWSVPMEVKTEKDVRLFAIRFKPLASEYLFDFDFRSFLNSTVILPSDFWKLDSLDLKQLEDFARYCTDYSNEILTGRKSIDDKKLRLFEVLFKKETFLVKEISEKVFWSSRQINRYFNKQYGMPLKVYLNILRCNDAYKKIAAQMPQSEYFDQAHFIKEIKKFTGTTPKELTKNKNDRFLQLSTLSIK